MVASRQTGNRSSTSKVATGFILDRPPDFYKKLRSALQKSLNLPFTIDDCKSCGTRELRYFREATPIHVSGSEVPLPALPLHTGTQSSWLVVEIECEGGKPTLLQHVSLKLHQGLTAEAATIRLRAEWDMRGRSQTGHAQPHWHVHAATTPSSLTADAGNTFSDFLSQQEPNTFAAFVASKQEVPAQTPQASMSQDCTLTPEQVHRFHLAMAVDWHRGSAAHSPEITDPDQMVEWIAACARYIRDQLLFVASCQQ